MKLGKPWQIPAVGTALMLIFPIAGQAAVYKDGPVANGDTQAALPRWSFTT
ncbi:MAG: hypothetical protein ACE5MG_07875 [Candidatus Methylomirabilales bacterium]